MHHLNATTGFVLVTVSLVGVGYFFWVDAQRYAKNLAGDPKQNGDVSATAKVAANATDTGVAPTAPLAPAAPLSPLPTATQPRATTSALPSPREQGATTKVLVEGHWQGMELLDLTPSLARLYGLDPSAKGLLVDEVTLLAAASGLRAGDVVYGIGSMRMTNLEDLDAATYLLRNNRQVELDVWRKGQPLTITLSSPRALGFAMVEGAQPILPGAISPHKDMQRPCTDCHLIMTSGGQLAKDAGDLLPTPPPITSNATPPHGDRGPCNVCHRIVDAVAGNVSAPSPQPNKTLP